MKRERSWEKVTKIGKKIREGWEKLARRHQLEISHNGILALAGFSFKYKNALAYKTLITQEMLKCGYLATTSCYASVAHTTNIIDDYLSELDKVFAIIAECEQGRPVEDMLEGPICHDTFKRLN